MRTSILLFCAFYSSIALAQNFSHKSELAFSSVTNPKNIAWVDFDNDTLLDLLTISDAGNGEAVLEFFKSDGKGVTEVKQLTTGMSSAAYVLADLDSDNSIDIILSGLENGVAATVVFFNKGAFAFERVKVIGDAGSRIQCADLNSDGNRELVLSGLVLSVPYLKIYEKNGTNWQVVNDSIKIAATSIEIFDFENDGDNDLFLSGTNTENKPLTTSFVNRGGFSFEASQDTTDWSGITALSDLNHDGLMDVILSGDDVSDQSHSVVYLNKQSSFAAKDTINIKGSLKVFSGDFTNDGKSDISFYGIANSLDSVNQILIHDGSILTLPSDSLRDQAFGDFDRDGDLDIAQLLVAGNEIVIRVLENTVMSKNAGPNKPFNAIGARIYDRIFVSWQRPEDDHTPKLSITYDLNIREANADLVTGSFDQLNEKRLLVAHGNNGTSNYALIQSASTSAFEYSIQAVDNAYHSSKNGVCNGVGICTQVVSNNLAACRNEVITLTGSAQATWYSFDGGFLGSGSAVSYIASESDTIFSVTPPSAGGCIVINVFTVTLAEKLTRIDDYTTHVCEGAVVDFQAQENFDAEWSSVKKGFLSSEQRISVKVTEPDTIKVKLSDGSGCNILKRTKLVISKPVLEVNAEAFQILKGESVQLQVNTDAETIAWNPPNGLDQSVGSAVIASPAQTTEYIVTVTDSIGCSGSGKILVIVEQTAFVPNLFTPNEDGNNDALKIFGLNDIESFTFSIYNREGSLVYSSGNASEVVNNGWNGMTHGIKQPGGVYYWKIKGRTIHGTKILLNGKTAGSVVLIR